MTRGDGITTRRIVRPKRKFENGPQRYIVTER